MLPKLMWLLVITAIPTEDPALSGDLPAKVQAEKLRMNVLELREISRSERLRNGGLFSILGAALATNAVVYFSEARNQFWVSPSANISQDFSLGIFGVILLGYGIYDLVTAPFEDQLWDELQSLNLKTIGDRAVFLAEGEARFEAAVQRAAFLRRLTGVLFIGVGLSSFGLHLGTTLASPSPPPAGYPDPRQPKDFFAREIVDLGALAVGLFFVFGVRTPSERAWGAYLNDKNLQATPVALAPLFLVMPNAAVAGLRGSF